MGRIRSQLPHPTLHCHYSSFIHIIQHHPRIGRSLTYTIPYLLTLDFPHSSGRFSNSLTASLIQSLYIQSISPFISFSPMDPSLSLQPPSSIPLASPSPARNSHHRCRHHANQFRVAERKRRREERERFIQLQLQQQGIQSGTSQSKWKKVWKEYITPFGWVVVTVRRNQKTSSTIAESKILV